MFISTMAQNMVGRELVNNTYIYIYIITRSGLYISVISRPAQNIVGSELVNNIPLLSSFGGELVNNTYI